MPNPCRAGTFALASGGTLGRGRGAAIVSQGGRWQLRVAAPDAAPATTALRLLSAVLLLEVIWLLLVASALMFLAAHLGSGTDELTGDAVSRRLLLVTVPPITVA